MREVKTVGSSIAYDEAFRAGYAYFAPGRDPTLENPFDEVDPKIDPLQDLKAYAWNNGFARAYEDMYGLDLT